MDAWVISALAEGDAWNEEMGRLLYDHRDQLSLYGKALLGIAFDQQKGVEQRDMLMRNIEQFLTRDKVNQTAYLKLPNSGYWWRWYGNDTETMAAYLRLLCRVKPEGETASAVARYLVLNRLHSSWWNSTRDTALSVEALAEYGTLSGEMKRAQSAEVEIWLDGARRQEFHFDAGNL